MSTALEIERAIEKLPAREVEELTRWLDDYSATLAASISVFQMLDEEEGEGDQLIGDPEAQ